MGSTSFKIETGYHWWKRLLQWFIKIPLITSCKRGNWYKEGRPSITETRSLVYPRLMYNMSQSFILLPTLIQIHIKTWGLVQLKMLLSSQSPNLIDIIRSFTKGETNGNYWKAVNCFICQQKRLRLIGIMIWLRKITQLSSLGQLRTD